MPFLSKRLVWRVWYWKIHSLHCCFPVFLLSRDLRAVQTLWSCALQWAKWLRTGFWIHLQLWADFQLLYFISVYFYSNFRFPVYSNFRNSGFFGHLKFIIKWLYFLPFLNFLNWIGSRCSRHSGGWGLETPHHRPLIKSIFDNSSQFQGKKWPGNFAILALRLYNR